MKKVLTIALTTVFVAGLASANFGSGLQEISTATATTSILTTDLSNANLGQSTAVAR